jgi:hypothetical protein
MRLNPLRRSTQSTGPAEQLIPARLATRHPARRRAVLPLLTAGLTVVAFVLAGGPAASAAPAHEVLALAADVNTVLNNVRNWIMGILAGLGTVFLTIGGIRYLMSAGDPGEVGKAKDAFKNAGWGFGLAALAPVAVEILKGIVGV